jgi:hypothetical protein
MRRVGLSILYLFLCISESICASLGWCWRAKDPLAPRTHSYHARHHAHRFTFASSLGTSAGDSGAQRRDRAARLGHLPTPRGAVSEWIRSDCHLSWIGRETQKDV